jgi:hypothetical protein
MIIKHFNLEAYPQVRAVQQWEAEKQISRRKSELEILHRICALKEGRANDSEYDFLSDGAQFSGLTHFKECSFTTMNLANSSRSDMNDHKVIVETLQGPIKLARILWEVLSRYLPPLNEEHCVSFQFYLKMINCAITGAGIH